MVVVVVLEEEEEEGPLGCEATVDLCLGAFTEVAPAISRENWLNHQVSEQVMEWKCMEGGNGKWGTDQWWCWSEGEQWLLGRPPPHSPRPPTSSASVGGCGTLEGVAMTSSTSHAYFTNLEFFLSLFLLVLGHDRVLCPREASLLR